MKQVILKESDTIIVNETCVNKYYGVSNAGSINPDSKGLITRQDYRDGYFKVLMLDSLTNGNGLAGKRYGVLTSFIESLIKSKVDVYEFDTSQELIKWLSE